MNVDGEDYASLTHSTNDNVAIGVNSSSIQ